MYRTERRPLPWPADASTLKRGSLRFDTPSLRELLDWLVRDATRGIAGVPGDLHEAELRELLAACSYVASLPAGAVREFALFELGRQAERCNVQGSELPFAASDRTKRIKLLNSHRKPKRRESDLAATIVSIAQRARRSHATSELVGIVHERLSNDDRPGRSRSAIRATLRAAGVLPPVKSKSRKKEKR